MAGESDHQVSTSEAARRTKGGKRGKATQRVQIDEEVTNDNEAEEESDSGDDDDRYDYRTLAKILETVPKLTSRNYYSWCTLIKANLRVVPYATRHLEGKYDRSHPKWNKTFDNALVGVLRSTLDTEGEHNVLHLLLDISKNHLTFHQAWKKIERSLTSEAARTSRRIALLAQLNEVKMFHADAHKLIQEIRAMQTETSLLGAPFSDDALYAALQRCTIRHPIYKETVATVHQVSFDALATALTTRQSAMESVPGQKVDPRQASARTAGTNEEQAYDAESDTGSAKTATKPKRIRCWEVWCSFTPSWQQLPKSGEATCWILDSGASYHMVNNHSMLIHPRNCRKRVYTAGSEVLEATAVGDVSIATEHGDVYLQNVLYVKRLNVNLLSTNSLTDEGARVTLDPTGGQIHLANGMLLKVAKDRERGLLEFRGDTWRQSAMTISTPLFEGVDEEFELANRRPKISTKQLWHERLGHPGRDKSRVIVDKLKGEPVIALDPDTALTCEQCIQSKSTVARMGQGSSERAARPLDLIHIDLIIDSSHVTEYTCTLVLVDDYSNHAFMQLKRIVSFLETQTDRKLKAIRSDQGTEWKSNEALEWSLSKGIEWQTTVGYNSRQNGRVERMNRSLGEKMRTLLMQRSLPKRFWPHAIRAAAFKLNLTPSVDGEFPYQLMFRKSPERFIRLMRVFGCLAWVNVPKAKRNNKKLDQRAVAAIFLGYSTERKGWLFYSPDYAPNIFWSNSARFMETQCWSDRSEWRPMSIRPPPVPTVEDDLDDLGYTEENLFDEGEQEPLEEYVDMESALEEEEPEASRIEDEAPNKGPKEREEYTPVPPERRGPWPNWRPARNMRNPETWVKRSYCGLTTARTEERKKDLNPTVHEALAGEDRRFWEEAMRKELDGLEAMGTWEITNLPRGMNTVDTRWVLKIKTDANMIPTKYKARLVARGFTQREGLDYAEIFAPVAPIQAIRGVLAIAAVRDWEVDSIDVKQAYLNSNLHHDVYLKPPVGTRTPPGKVLKLVKGLYGLKQSGREWNIELDSHLRKIGFHCMPSAPCLYSRGVGEQLTVITAYVDDMLIVSPSRREVDRTKAEIMDKWGTEDNGPVKEFLGIKITRERKQGKISLDLIAYIKSMVSKWLKGPNERTWIPMQSVAGAAGGDRCTPDRAKQYQELVGQLLWVSNTVRPDISFAVGTLARYMSEPIDSAWKAAIHLLKYLNQTNDYHLNLGGLHRSHAGEPVVTYTDANWASDPTNGRRSTSGAITYVYGCPVSWKSHVQKCVALSAVEAELVAASEAAREALFFSYLLRDLGIAGVKPILRTDSQGCIQVSKDPAKHWKLKHIDTRYHFVRDHVQDGDISIEFVGTANNVADILTKPLKGLSTTKASRMIGLDMPLRRGVEDTPASSRRDMLDQNTHDREIGKAPSDKEDEIGAKLVGAHAAYARGLTPWYAGGMTT
ncbi:uncharacterized protein UDID_17076 [Ustilago sp. UG-2017a]|nr:uncharacterized protein UDID_17076 [Ustilago sp. UG-2017a]